MSQQLQEVEILQQVLASGINHLNELISIVSCCSDTGTEALPCSAG